MVCSKLVMSCLGGSGHPMHFSHNTATNNLRVGGCRSVEVPCLLQRELRQNVMVSVV